MNKNGNESDEITVQDVLKGKVRGASNDSLDQALQELEQELEGDTNVSGSKPTNTKFDLYSLICDEIARKESEKREKIMSNQTNILVWMTGFIMVLTIINVLTAVIRIACMTG